LPWAKVVPPLWGSGREKFFSKLNQGWKFGPAAGRAVSRPIRAFVKRKNHPSVGKQQTEARWPKLPPLRADLGLHLQARLGLDREALAKLVVKELTSVVVSGKPYDEAVVIANSFLWRS
jgi:hypothetical protein